ncbi:uncharacterized protein LOC132447509 [Gadus macrocephalus]|uniref:uncharacterized protein LOC132447509 n=1 Tax=Gadus macrocephalus TaxID=80720 RepID=UPI0028CB2DE5|nr:uncharacterized protein LOC132447509 [Gadus macrocephalus]
MDDALIVAVCGQSVLYDNTLVFYRDRIKKQQAWVVVGEETGIPVDVCRRKWKSLRDRYIREKRKEEGKKIGSAARTVKKWKFSAVLSFLDPFVTPKETSSNHPRWAEIEVKMEDDWLAENSGVGEADEERDEAAAAAAGPSHNTDQLSGNESDPDDVPAAAATPAPVPAAGPAPRPPSGMKRKRASGVPCGNTPIQEAILQALQRDGQLCADAQFFNGLLPSLKRLPPDAKEYVKFQIHKVIFDATQITLNLEPV